MMLQNDRDLTGYRPEIDGLRALAVVSVIFYHAGIAGFSGGFIGVDIFFVISGFLITGGIHSEHVRGQFSFRAFYERRARRILPALLFAMALTAPVAWLLATPSQMIDFSQSIVATLLFTSNILFLNESGYFEGVARVKPLLHTWSLSVEEQFYLALPLVMFFARLVKKPRIETFVFLVMAIASFLSLHTLSSDPEKRFYLITGRVWEFMLGSLSFMASLRLVNVSQLSRIRELGSSVSILLILVSVRFFDETTPHPSWPSLIPTTATALFLLLTSSRTGVGKVLSSPIPRNIGLMSYSLYLVHQPVLSFAEMRAGSVPTNASLLFVFGIIGVLSVVSYTYVEVPFRSKSIGTRRFVACLAIPIVSLSVFGAFGHFSGGFKNQRLSRAKLGVLESARRSPFREQCHASDEYDFPVGQACILNSGPTKVAVIGDSHAVELPFALARLLESQNISVLQLSRSGCPPAAFRRISIDDNCLKWTREAVNLIDSKTDISTVIVSYRLHSYLFGEHESVYPKIPNSIASELRQDRWQNLLDIIEHFTSRGRTVVLVLQAPELPRRLEDAVMVSNDVVDRMPGVSRSWWNERSQWVMERLNQLPLGTIVVNPADSLCDSLNCYAVIGKQAMYFDGNHLSVAGAEQIAKTIVSVSALKQ